MKRAERRDVRDKFCAGWQSPPEEQPLLRQTNPCRGPGLGRSRLNLQFYVTWRERRKQGLPAPGTQGDGAAALEHISAKPSRAQCSCPRGSPGLLQDEQLSPRGERPRETQTPPCVPGMLAGVASKGRR